VLLLQQLLLFRCVVCSYCIFPDYCSRALQFSIPSGVFKYLAVVLFFWSKRQGPLCDLGSFIPAVLLHWRESESTCSGESSAGSETDTHHRHTQRHIHTSSASCDALHILLLVIGKSYILA
jgi:hypothetical protein